MAGTLLHLPLSASTHRALNIGLWCGQILLALAFGMAGYMHAVRPITDLATMAPWVTDVPELLVRFIGTCELCGALGVILPAVTRIQPVLTPLASTGLLTMMVLALGFHTSRDEYPMLIAPVVLGLLAAFVAWGRYIEEPIEEMK